MAGALEILFSNVLVASALALVIGLTALRLKRPALLHSLWILVLLKLVTPPVLPVGVLPPELARFEAAGANEVPFPWWEPAAAVVSPGDSGLEASRDRARPRIAPGPASPSGATAAGHPVEAKVSAAASPSIDLVSIAFGAWVAGSLLVFSVAFIRAARFRRLLAKGEPAPPAVQGRARRVAACLGRFRCPPVWLVPGRVSPLVWALPFTRPRLVVPVGILEQLSPDEFESLLAHELAHVKRRDHWVRWLELLVTGLFWWLPVVWLARRALRSAEEQCCDAWVVWSLPNRAEAYARALLHTLEFLAGSRTAMPPVASGARHVRQLERRLTMIMERTPPRMLGTAARLAVAVAAVLMLSFVPTWAQESREDEIREAKRKLHRVERAMVELREAGLEREVQHLERVADKLRRSLDRIDAVNGKRVPARPARPAPPRPPRPPRLDVEERARQRAELEERIDQLKRSGRHDEARAAYLEFKTLDDARKQAEAARAAGMAEREQKIVALERHLAELKAHYEKMIQAGRRHKVDEVGEEMDRVTRELDHARQALERFVIQKRERGTPTETERKRAATAFDEQAVRKARARIEAAEHARLRALQDERAALVDRLDAARASGLIIQTEELERKLENVADAIERARRNVERSRSRPEGEAKWTRAVDFWRFVPDREGEARFKLQRILEEHQRAIVQQQQVIAALERTLAETTRRYDGLRVEMERLEQILREMKARGELKARGEIELEWKKPKKEAKEEKKRRKI